MSNERPSILNKQLACKCGPLQLLYLFVLLRQMTISAKTTLRVFRFIRMHGFPITTIYLQLFLYFSFHVFFANKDVIAALQGFCFSDLCLLFII